MKILNEINPEVNLWKTPSKGRFFLNPRSDPILRPRDPQSGTLSDLWKIYKWKTISHGMPRWLEEASNSSRGFGKMKPTNKLSSEKTRIKLLLVKGIEVCCHCRIFVSPVLLKLGLEAHSILPANPSPCISFFGPPEKTLISSGLAVWLQTSG